MSALRNNFYKDEKYRKLQSEIARQNWRDGLYNHRISPLTTRKCKNTRCRRNFAVKPYDPKEFCSRSCVAIVRNLGRKQSEETKAKISKSVKLLPFERRGKHFTKAKVRMVCANCKKVFELVPYLSKTQKYCSIHCNIVTQGRKTTSPKASKGKNGVRPDINLEINFYSTWEANIARVYNLIGLKWEYAPRLFDLGRHTYRPDFYLPEFDEYVEIKNFMNFYSRERDILFREKYPNIELKLIMKEDYMEIKSNYRGLVENWEN